MASVTDPAATRPPQTTLAGWMVMGGSAFLVVSSWTSVANLRSIETREAIEDFLREAPADGWGLSVEGATQTLHVMSLVAAACAVLCVGLGWQVLRRDRNARLALSVLAVPLFVSGLIAGGLMASFVAAAIAMLWLAPSRQWLNGMSSPPAAGRPTALFAPPREPTPTPTRQPTNPPAGRDEQSSPWSSAPTAATSRPSPATARPDAVLVALILTLTMAGLVFLTSLISITMLASQPDLVLEELRRQNPEIVDQGVSESLIRSSAYVSGVIGMLWSGAAVLFAVLTMMRRRWAAIALGISAAATTVLCLAFTIASLMALVPAAAAMITLSCLRRPDVRRWLAGDHRRSGF